MTGQEKKWHFNTGEWLLYGGGRICMFDCTWY